MGTKPKEEIKKHAEESADSWHARNPDRISKHMDEFERVELARSVARYYVWGAVIAIIGLLAVFWAFGFRFDVTKSVCTQIGNEIGSQNITVGYMKGMCNVVMPNYNSMYYVKCGTWFSRANILVGADRVMAMSLESSQGMCAGNCVCVKLQ
jgi:hypothetical protein